MLLFAPQTLAPPRVGVDYIAHTPIPWEKLAPALFGGESLGDPYSPSISRDVFKLGGLWTARGAIIMLFPKSDWRQCSGN